ncbi:MAG: hypothetical protein AB7L66_03630 [Gemmatimonadales bacterium]
MPGSRAAKAGAACYFLWGLIHVVGGLAQLAALRQGGGGALAAMISSASPVDPATPIVAPAAAFMGMGAANIVVFGVLVAALARLNWNNDTRGYWLNLLIVGAVDVNLALFLLLPGHMAWSDGLVGIGLFVPAALLTTLARRQPSPMAFEARGVTS